MIIGIDGNEANIQKRVGIGEYAFELMRQFSKLQSSNVQFQIFLKNKPLLDLPSESARWKYIIFGPSPFWTQLALPVQLFFERKKTRCVFFPNTLCSKIQSYAYRYFDYGSFVSFLSFTFSQTRPLQLTNWTAYSAKKARLIFTISKASRDDIIKVYNVPEKRVVVTYPGIKPFVTLTPQVYTTTMLQESLGITRPYFLFVGTLQQERTLSGLLRHSHFFAKI